MNNMIHVLGTDINTIKLYPGNLVEEIIQNIQIILTTTLGSVPLDRKFGTTCDFVDEPHPKAMMKLSIFITESIQEYEPRVEVQTIEFVQDIQYAMNGKLVPKVSVRIKDEYLSS